MRALCSFQSEGRDRVDPDCSVAMVMTFELVWSGESDQSGQCFPSFHFVTQEKKLKKTVSCGFVFD